MPYEVEARLTREKMYLEADEWWNLLALAHRYGWEAEEGLDHYLYNTTRVSAEVARDIAYALANAVPNLPEEERTRAQPTNTTGVWVTESVLAGRRKTPWPTLGATLVG